MIPERHCLVTASRLWRQWADEHGLRYDSGESCDEIASDYKGTSGAHREPLADDHTGTTSAPHRAAVNIAFVRALFIGDAIRRRDGALDSLVDVVHVLDPDGRIVPRRSGPELDGESESIATPGGPHKDVVQPQHFPSTGLRP